MPQLNRVTLVDRQYAVSVQSKGEDFSIEPILAVGERVLEVEVGQTYPNCVPIDHDCNWFLGRGVTPTDIPTCQLGALPGAPANLRVTFPGAVTYKVRPGKISRDGFRCWVEKTGAV